MKKNEKEHPDAISSSTYISVEEVLRVGRMAKSEFLIFRLEAVIAHYKTLNATYF
jgi:hypothetical protein